MRRKVSPASMGFLLLIAFATNALLREAELAEAVTCNAVELSSCWKAITSAAVPSAQCCTKLREQRPCLCGYIKDPNFSPYVNSPNARRVASTCGVPFPTC